MGDQEVYCAKCDWNGKTADLYGLKCPKCGDSMHIEDCEPLNEPDYMVLGSGKFNWNRK